MLANLRFARSAMLCGAALVFTAVLGAGAAQAAAIIYDFTSTHSTDNYGTTENYTSSGITITANAGSWSGSTVSFTNAVLVGNNRGTDEQGLGACVGTHCDSNHDYQNDPEINGGELVQLDITNLLAAGYTSLAVNADSATQGETLGIYSSTTMTGLGTLEASITSANGTVSIFHNGNFLNFIYNGSNVNAGGEDVLLHSLTASKPVPEPMSIALLGGGLLGLGMIRRSARRTPNA